MKVLGIDWGEKRIGLALADSSLARTYGTVSSIEALLDVIEREEVQRVVLGLPEGRFEKTVKDLGSRIERECGIPVVLRSEVLTSRLAQARMIEAGRSRKSRSKLDEASAALILQEYLDANHPR